MSLAMEILEELWNKTYFYKGLRVNIFGVPKFKNKNYDSLKATANRLKRAGYLQHDKDGWSMTLTGKKYFEDKISFTFFDSPFKRESPKNLLLMFDIPEEKRQHRDWLRTQLREYGYIMIQRSVWVGPSPLPKEFTDYIKSLKIKSCLKTFKLAKAYSNK